MSTKNDVLFMPGKEGFRFRQEKRRVCLYKILLNSSATAPLLPVTQREFVLQSALPAPSAAALASRSPACSSPVPGKHFPASLRGTASRRAEQSHSCLFRKGSQVKEETALGFAMRVSTTRVRPLEIL